MQEQNTPETTQTIAPSPSIQPQPQPIPNPSSTPATTSTPVNLTTQQPSSPRPSSSSQQFQILPQLTPEQEAEMAREHRQRLQNFYGKNKKYEIDYWYDAIKQFTYPSFSFPLTVAEAYLLHCMYYEYQIGAQMGGVTDRLIAKLQQVISKAGGRCFMKLSTRSPKDYCWDYRNPQTYNKAVSTLKSHLLSLSLSPKTTSPSHLLNLLYNFFLEHSQNRLLIRQPMDFLNIFSKSQRIITDINDLAFLGGGLFEKIGARGQAVEDKEKKEGEDKDKDKEGEEQKTKNKNKNTGMEKEKEQKDKEMEMERVLVNVWVREWAECKWQWQFRTFYHNYSLTGITQYDQRCYFPNLPPKQKIAQSCLTLFTAILPKLKQIDLSEGVLDMMLSPTQAKIVEINVFDRDARASLFDWGIDEQILRNGPLEVRILEKEGVIDKAYLGSIMGMIDKRSMDVVQEVLADLGFDPL